MDAKDQGLRYSPEAVAGASLTREGLEALLAYLDPDRERAGEKYEKIRRRLVKLFECRGIALPEEPADETIDRVARRLAAGEQIHAAEPGAYFYGVARNVLRELWARQREQRAAPELVATAPAPDPADDADDAERRATCLGKCLATLSPESRSLVVEYYRQGGGARKIAGRKDLAARMGISINTLWVRAHRARGRLERCVRECLDRNGASKRPQGPLQHKEGEARP
jgi:DNA-directed RNA polymerase specialized sigma24 family protein